MNKKGHTFGCIAVSCISYYTTKDPIIIPGIIIGSFLPDLDAEYSYIRSKLPILAIVYDILPKNNFTKHRGALLHSFLTLLICYFLNLKGLCFGILGHHILDMLTPAGLTYFYPFKIKIKLLPKKKKIKN